MVVGSEIEAAAEMFGFALQGVVAIPDDYSAPKADHLTHWLANEYHGPLAYIKKNAATRKNLKDRFPWARSILCVGMYYDAKERGQKGEDLIAHVARYARGRDYHLVFEKRLKKFAQALVARSLCQQARWYVDTGPVMERAWAEEAGLGWIGKNGCLITSFQGSYLLLGELLLDTEVPVRTPHLNHCGNCTQCLDACPTDAFAAPGILDARKCIVTWNLELKGRVGNSLWGSHAGWAAGCDICQEVCPYNQRKAKPDVDPELAAPLPWQNRTLAEAIEMTKEQFDLDFKGSALRRTGWVGIRLGAITVAGNLRAESCRRALVHGLKDQESLIRERAAWALQELDWKHSE